MLTENLTMEEIANVRYEEGLEYGWEEGWEGGLEYGREEGLEQGHMEEKALIAQNLLSEGSTPEFVQKITGLDLKTVQELAAKQG
jgi:predicted transposase/invertase (TIGR01784 family)